MRWLALITVVGVLGTAVAAPQVEIKAQTSLTLGSVRLLGDGQILVTGQLLDKLTGEGIDGQTVIIMIAGEQKFAATDPEGKFRVLAPGEPGTQKIELVFRGSRSLEKAEPVALVTDPSRAQVALTIRTEATPHGLSITVAGMIDDRAVVLPIDVSIGTPQETELRPFKQVNTNQPFLLSRADAGGAGSRRVRAAFAGDDTRQPALAEATIELTTGSQTAMTVKTASLAYEDDLKVAGKVTDEDGKPLARAAVTLTAGDRRLAQGATAADGTFKFEVEAEILGKGQFGIWVQSDPGSPFVRPSKSEPTIITIAMPQPVPVSYTIAAFLATALAAGGFFLARSKPWNRFRRTAAPADAPEKAEATDAVEGGLVVAKPGIVSTLRRPYDDTFSGSVRDTVRGRPVDAIVRLVLGPKLEAPGSTPGAGVEERELRTEADGSFQVERLAVGEWRAEVSAPGHVTEKFAVTIPHRGELRGVRVDLVPVRERVFQLYRRAAEPVLPEAKLWGIWSPRQIVDHVRTKKQSPALADLTDFVEEVYFSPRIAAETILPGASERVDRAVRERLRMPQ
ncbi:MAG: carboxypeptidase-like regulatory domain-containing protein [Myxococcota bacterium]|nr:carboxypeptidase-like regulatory domain-containing protein [Myxococcota bacterium]